ncbi:MAG: hypothetical protein IKK27_04530, partial [Alistipes sp.]|nr:hypothetical protein [Alistipes sp.]
MAASENLTQRLANIFLSLSIFETSNFVLKCLFSGRFAQLDFGHLPTDKDTIFVAENEIFFDRFSFLYYI